MRGDQVADYLTLAYLDDAAQWQSITGEAVSLTINRGGKPAGVQDDLDTGMITLSLVSADLNPAAGGALRRGVQFRVQATAPADSTLETLFTGVIDYAEVSYPDKADPDALPIITVTGVDAQQQLGNTPAPYGYAGPLEDKIASLVQPTGLPWTVNGVDQAGNAGAEVLSVEDDAKVWDQLILARNSTAAHLWISRAGRVCAADPGTVLGDRGPNILTDGSFEAGGDNWQPNPGETVNAEIDTTHARTGAQALKVSTDQQSGGYELSLSTGLHVDPGDTVIFSGYAWRDAPASALLRINGGGTAVNANVPATVGVWNYTEAQATAVTSGAVSIYLYTQTANVPVWFDDLELHVIRAVHLDALDLARSFTKISAGYSTRAVVNALTITKANLTVAPVENSKTFGPYLNQASAESYGTLADSLDVMDGTPSELAHTYLARTGTPAVVPSSVTLTPGTNPYAIQAELYDRVTIANYPDVDPSTVWVVVGIAHTITSGEGWLTELTLRAPIAEDANVTITEPPAGADTGPIDAMPAPARPGEPVLVSKLGAIVITWDGLDNTGAAAGYLAEVWRTNPTPAVMVGRIPHGGGTVVDAGLDYSTEYTYQLRAVNRYGVASDYSDPAFITPIPVVPTDLVGRVIAAANIKLGTITADVLADGAVTNVKISDDAITAPKIAAGAVIAGKIAADSVGTAELIALSVTADELAANAVTAAKISAGAVEADKIAANAVTSAAIAAGAITAEKIEATAIDSMTITSVRIQAGTIATGDRTAYNDTEPGLFIRNDGVLTINNSEGVEFLRVDPLGGDKFQVGGADHYLRYTVGTGILELSGSFRTGGDQNPRISISNDTWAEGTDPSISFLVMDQGDGTNNHGPHLWSNNSSFDIGGDITPVLNTGAMLISLAAVDLATDPNDVPYFHHVSFAPRTAMIATRKAGLNEYAALFEMYDDINVESLAGSVLLSAQNGSGSRSWFTLGPDPDESGSGHWDLSATGTGGFYYRRYWTDSVGGHFQVYAGGGSLASWIDMLESGDTKFGGILWSADTYNNTYTGTNAVDVRVGPAGQITSNGSAARFKAAIQDHDFGDAILDLAPKVWYDKGAADRYADMITEAAGDSDKLAALLEQHPIPDPMTVIPGVVAEDVKALGLDQFVQYDDAGQVHGVAYDRLWIPLVPIIKKLVARVAALEGAKQ
jgi:hypothetical protein